MQNEHMRKQSTVLKTMVLVFIVLTVFLVVKSNRGRAPEPFSTASIIDEKGRANQLLSDLYDDKKVESRSKGKVL